MICTIFKKNTVAPVRHVELLEFLRFSSISSAKCHVDCQKSSKNDQNSRVSQCVSARRHPTNPVLRGRNRRRSRVLWSLRKPSTCLHACICPHALTRPRNHSSPHFSRECERRSPFVPVRPTNQRIRIRKERQFSRS